ncbi:MAG TPA: copper resistance protein B [Vicinamibacterales bacterium]|nr:copper resistance protein B [Vicinamibacterales bacterium]
MTHRLWRILAVGTVALLANICPVLAQSTPAPAQPTPPQHEHGRQQAPGDQAKPTAPKDSPAGIPPISDEDRAAAFPQLDGHGHSVHDRALHSYVLFDQLELQPGKGGATGSWDTRGWFGGDVNRFWFRTEGDAGSGGASEAQAHALVGRAIHRWWDVVAGVRQDFRPGPARTWAAIGIQGLAPYWFEVEATAYLGVSGRTHFRFETEYELLLTNRLVLQPLVELEIYGKDDPERHIAAGLSSAETGLRVRYEIRREFAPYVGVTWHRKLFGTADLAKAAGEDTGGARFATGVRVWF